MEWTVADGRKPRLHVAPSSIEVAQPMSDAPPLKKRPTWNADTIVSPQANVSGSTSVLCWLSEFVNGSSLTVGSSRMRVTRSVNFCAPGPGQVASHRITHSKVVGCSTMACAGSVERQWAPLAGSLT